jgi:predicted nucleotidyltransferase
MVTPRPRFDRERIAAFCDRHRIRRLALFGSILREDFDATSDVDVLVEFEAGAKAGLAFFAMQDELSEMVGHQVDLNTPGFLSPHFRGRVLEEAQDVYVAS